MAVELATAYVSIVPTTKGITGAIAGQLGAPLSAASSKAGKDAGTKFSSGFKKSLKVGAVGLAAVGLVTASIVKDAVQLEAAFSQTMRQVAVASRAPQAQLKELDRLALKLGADTVFSANEAASAMLSLAKGGLTPAQIRAGALANTLTLATAGELELGDAADTVVGTMGAFQLGAKDTGAAVAALAGAANASRASVSDITQALSQAGTEANATGLSVQETTAILAAFADAGIDGSDAGTSLRTMLGRLVPQTDKAAGAMNRLGLDFTKANGEFVGAEQIAQRLQNSFDGLSASERSTALSTIFGSDSRRAANILISEGADGLRNYIKQTSDLDQAQKLANATMEGTSGALKALEGNVETAQLKLGKALAPVVIDLSERFGDFLETAPIRQWSQQTINGVSAVVQELTPLAISLYDVGRDALPILLDAGGLTVDLLEVLLKVAQPLVSTFNALPGPVRDLALAMGAASFALPGMVTRIGAAGTAVSNFVLDLRTAPSKIDAVKGRMSKLGIEARSLAGAAGLGALLVASQEVNPAMRGLEAAVGGALTGFSVAGGPGALIGGLAGGFLGLATASDDAAESLSGYEQRQKDALAAGKELLGTINSLNGAYTRSTRIEVAKQILENDNLAVLREHANLNDLVSVALGNRGAAFQRVTQAYKDGNLITRGSFGDSVESVESFNRRSRESVLHAFEFTDALRHEHNQLGTVNRGIKDYTKALDGLPKQVITDVQARNGKLSADVVAEYQNKLDLLPKDVVTLVRETGTRLTAKEIHGLFDEYDRLPPSVVTYLKQSGASGVLADVRAMRRGIDTELHGIKDEPIKLSIEAQTVSTLAKIAEFAPQMHAAGGRLHGPGSGTSDSIPIYASSGEFIIREAIARRIYPFLEALNAGQTEAFQAAAPGFANGGRVNLDPQVLTSGALAKVGNYAALVGGWASGLASDIGTVISSIVDRLFAFGGNGQPLGFDGSLSWGQIAQGQQFAQSQAGKPYVWASAGPYGFDCSGFVGAVLNAALGRYPYSRVGSTGTMPWSGSSPGVGRYTIGWFTGDPGHTSGNIGGLGVESAGGVGVQLGSAARSPLDSMFNGLMHYDTGGWLRPGYTLAYNGTGRNEIVAAYAEGGKVEKPGPVSDKFVRQALRPFLVVFGRQSPVVDAIERWLSQLKKGEFEQRELNRRLREVVRAQRDTIVRQFKVGPAQTRSETRGEVRELLSAMAQLLGKDAPVIKRLGAMGDKLVDAQAHQDKAVAGYERANDKLDAITARQRQIVADVRQAFTHEAFADVGSVGESRLQIRADANDARKTLRQLRLLSAKGLDAGILKQIARSGNTALIRQLARMTPKQIKAYERDIKARNKATANLGQFVGNKVLGPQVRAQRRVVQQLSQSVKSWDRVIERMENRVERATERGARRGIQAGMKEQERNRQRRRRAGVR